MSEDAIRIKREEARSAVLVLARAFMTDPLWVFLYENPASRMGMLRRFFKPLVLTAIERNQAFGVGAPIEGTAVWRRPGDKRRFSPESLLLWLSLLGSTFPAKAVSVRKVFAGFAAMHRSHGPGSHYFLETLGVLPARQGTGAAGRLMRPFIEQAETHRLPVYTETVTPENVGFYEHFGFVRVETRSVPNHNLEMFALLKTK